MSIVKGYDLPVEFPEKVLNQAERVGKEVSEADMAGRMDLRDWQTCREEKTSVTGRWSPLMARMRKILMMPCLL